jgi:hypothetical protein
LEECLGGVETLAVRSAPCDGSWQAVLVVTVALVQRGGSTFVREGVFFGRAPGWCGDLGGAERTVRWVVASGAGGHCGRGCALVEQLTRDNKTIANIALGSIPLPTATVTTSTACHNPSHGALRTAQVPTPPRRSSKKKTLSRTGSRSHMNGTRAQTKTKKRRDTVALVGLLITTSDGDETATLDGDGNAIYSAERYTSKVPDMFKKEVQALARPHPFALFPCPQGSPDGIYALDFHYWVLSKINELDEDVGAATRRLSIPQYIAAEIASACVEWVALNK